MCVCVVHAENIHFADVRASSHSQFKLLSIVFLSFSSISFLLSFYNLKLKKRIMKPHSIHLASEQNRIRNGNYIFATQNDSIQNYYITFIVSSITSYHQRRWKKTFRISTIKYKYEFNRHKTFSLCLQFTKSIAHFCHIEKRVAEMLYRRP